MEIHAFQPHDLASVVDLLQKTLTADPMTSEIFQRKVLLDENFDPKGAQVAVEDGKVAGFMLSLIRKFRLEDSPDDSDRSWITLAAVDPDYQRKGIGSALLERVTEYVKSKGAKSIWVSSYAPNYFMPGVDVQAYPAALELFNKHGFTELIQPLSMDASLLGLRTPEWVDDKEKNLLSEGVSFQTYTPEMILPLLDFLKREFPGDWQRYVRETMVKITLGQATVDQVFIAHQNGAVLGFCQHEGERFGPFGTAKSERGRGIGAVLLFKCLHTMRNKGLHNAWFLWTDDKVAKLYAQAGFMETRRYALLKKMI